MHDDDPEAETGAAAEIELVDRWRAALDEASVRSLFAALADEVREETRQRRPMCIASGTCCRFESFGHRLYLTGLETVWVLEQLEQAPSRAEIDGAVAAGTCPFLVRGLCSVHLVRPLGCRTFFCDRGATDWQQALHERCHEAIRRLHAELDLPYRYGEWRAMLARCVTARA